MVIQSCAILLLRAVLLEFARISIVVTYAITDWPLSYKQYKSMKSF